ncbi:transcriptional regulator [Bacillaceae bacterium SAOS 7]|nr:transcriptional regulator [Bacillaceae bacterium SAOS 7]
MNEREHYLLKRRRKKITQKELSIAIGVSQAFISQYESGKKDMSEAKEIKYQKYINNSKN